MTLTIFKIQMDHIRPTPKIFNFYLKSDFTKIVISGSPSGNYGKNDMICLWIYNDIINMLIFFFWNISVIAIKI